MPSEGPQVEFDRLVSGPLFQEGGLAAVNEQAVDPVGPARFWRSVRIVRWGAMTSGAAALAWLTHRSGLSLDGALCVFVGLLPLLWVFGWFAGISIGARRVAAGARSAVSRVDLSGRVARAGQQSEHVQLRIADDVLEVTLQRGEATQSHRWPWKEVRLDRHVGEAFWLVRHLDGIEVPRAAFADTQAFESFALAAQSRIWSTLK